MAAERRPNVLHHDAAGQSHDGRFHVWALVWNGSTAAGDDLQVKDGSGTVVLALKAGANTGHLVLYWPFGPHTFLDGIETDVIDAGTVEYVLA
jgi:hypothetical protein